MDYFKRLEGERLYLSPLNIKDVDKYIEWMADINFASKLGSTSRIFNKVNEAEFVEEKLKTGDYIFGIIEKETNELIGNCSIFNIDSTNSTAEIGIMIGKESARGKGYGTESMGILADYSFNYLNFNSLFLKVKEFNPGAIRCYEKVGFKLIGKRRNSAYVNGKYYNNIYMDLLKTEFDKDYIINKEF